MVYISGDLNKSSVTVTVTVTVTATVTVTVTVTARQGCELDDTSVLMRARRVLARVGTIPADAL
jgi:hypothetical protein